MDGVAEDFDATAPETFDSTIELYADMRGRCPVAHSDSWGGFWALLKFDDVLRAAADWKTFTTTVQNVVPKVAFTGRRAPLHLDPPEHTLYRQALNPLLGEAQAAAMEPATRRFALELIAPMVAKGGGDICDEYAAKVPIALFAEWMRLPQAMVDVLRSTAQAFTFAVQSAQDDVMKTTSLELYTLARDLIELRKREPQDPTVDPTSALLAARDEHGEPLPDEMILGCVRQVLVVGIVAPQVVIGSFSVHLSRHPELQAELRAHPKKIPEALEELLRLYTPYRGFARTPTQDVTIRGRTIKKDEAIAIVYASANRDEDKFPNPDEFQWNRPNIKDHLAFGAGPHRCAGMNLARMELQVMLEVLLANTGSFEVSGPIKPTRCPEIGALSVPLRFSKAS